MILDKLFGGEFRPGEMAVPKNDRYRKLVDEVSRLQVKIKQELSEEQYAEVEKLHDGVSELGSIDAEEYFKYGFSSGVMLSMEIYQYLQELEKSNE